VLNSGGNGLPRELAKQRRGVVLRRVRVVARPCGVRALNARTRVREQVHAGAWGRRAWVPSSGAGPARGGAEPSSEADPAQGGVRASSEADFTRGVSTMLSWRAAGATKVVFVLCMCVRCAS
jgi:hypothetical protein